MSGKDENLTVTKLLEGYGLSEASSGENGEKSSAGNDGKNEQNVQNTLSSYISAEIGRSDGEKTFQTQENTSVVSGISAEEEDSVFVGISYEDDKEKEPTKEFSIEKEIPEDNEPTREIVFEKKPLFKTEIEEEKTENVAFLRVWRKSEKGSPKTEMEAETKTETEIKTEMDGNESGNFLGKLLPKKGDSVKEIIRKIVFLAAVTVFVIAGAMLAGTLIQSKRAVRDKQEVQSVIITTAATTIDTDGSVVTVPPTVEEVAEHNFNVAQYFRNITEDYVGYIELDGCDIHEPVVQTSNNDYYLTHTYYGGTNKAGTVFMDYRCEFGDEYISPNIIVYGHNQEDGTMFGNLKYYKDNADFYKENHTVRLSSENTTYEYIIYAYFVTNTLARQDSFGEVFHYHDYIEKLNDEETFNWYIKEVAERNSVISPVDVRYGDKLLCLSTCSNEFSNLRFVVLARMLREGENESDYDFSSVRLNPDARRLDVSAILSEETSETAKETEDPDAAGKNGKKKKKKTETAQTESGTETETTRVSEETASETTADAEETSETETTSVSTAAAGTSPPENMVIGAEKNTEG